MVGERESLTMPANILNLPCYKVRGIQENEHDYHVEVETGESFARMVPKPAPEPKPYIPKSTETDRREKNYGADISTLIRMIENGEL